MALQFRKVLEEQRLTFTPVIGEPVYTLDTRRLYLGDGVTPGGVNIISNITVQDFVNAELDEDNLKDGDFLWYSDAENKWKIGKHPLETSGLDDVTTPEEVEPSFMLVYNAETSKWIVREPLPKSLDDIQEFTVSSELTVDSLLEYNQETSQFESTAIPPVPTIGSLLGVSINTPVKRGHLLFLDEETGDFDNGYISYSTGGDYYADLNGMQSLDTVKFNGETGVFEKSTPFLKDVNLVSLAGLEEPPPDDIIFNVSVNEGNFIINEVIGSAPQIEIFDGRVHIFDLSDPTLLGKTFAFSLVQDGTHSIDPPGTIIERDRITFTGTPGIDGQARIDLLTEDDDLIGLEAEFYYFCVEEPEFGNKVIQSPKPTALPFVLQWDEQNETFDIKRFSYSIGDLGDVLLTPDEDGRISNFQMLSWDSGLQKWTTPLDRVVGLGIGGSLPRTYTQYSNAMWAGGVRGLGTFDLTLEEGSELKSITIKLDELEIEGQEEELDAYFFDSEEEREEFLEAIEEAEEFLRNSTGDPNAVLSREAIDELAKEKGAKIARLETNKKAYTRVGKSKVPTAGVEVEMGGGGGAGGIGGLGAFGSLDLGGLGGGLGGFGGGGGGGEGEGAQEPGLDELTTPVPDPEEEAEAFKNSYKNFGNNLKKVFAAIMAKRRALKKLLPDSLAGGGGLGGGLDIEFETTDPTGASSQDKPPMMLGWRASTDIYGYYYFTYTQRGSALTYNSRNHELIAQSKMRRCGCTLSKGNTFKVVFYYDADDSRYMAGQWLRIVEWQNPRSLYTGDLEEFPSATIREGLEEWNIDTKYRRGARVIYNDKVWECMIEVSEAQPPEAGTTLAPTAVDGEVVQMFVEIPAFSVKAQLFEGVYQLRCTLGKDSFGGKTHPIFRFGEPGDEADYIYVGATLVTNNWPSRFTPESYVVEQLQLDTKLGHRQLLQQKNLDIGCFLYDINVHSAIQHLMVGEFQTFNIEKRLGECNLAPTSQIYSNEREFTLGLGNASGCTQVSTVPGSPPAGIPTYRGIFRPYGNMGCFIDGLNIDSLTGAASFNLDGNTHNDSSIQPPGYTFLENLPKPALTSGTGAAFISNFFTWRRQDYSDFVFYLPKTLGGGRESFMGDRIKYRQIPSTSSLVVPSFGSPYASPINAIQGENGPFNLNIQPLSGSNHVFATRYCVKRRGSPLVSKTVQTGTKELGTITDAEGNIIARNVEQSQALPGQNWTLDRTVPTYEVVAGNDRPSGEAGTSTVSLARIEASRSAVCIGVCDETDAYGQSARDGYFLTKWNEFRAQYPNRPHWLLCPNATGSNEFTAPFPTSIMDINTPAYPDFSLDFPDATPWWPRSRNQRTSLPLTHNVSSERWPELDYYNWSMELKQNAVFVYDVTQVQTRPSLQGEVYNISYKIRIPSGLYNGIAIRFSADNEITAQITNPLTGNTFNLGSHTDWSTTRQVTYTAQQVEDFFTPQELIDDNEWLTLKVTYKNGNDGPNWSIFPANPGAYFITITTATTGGGGVPAKTYQVFNAKDWSSIKSDIYSAYIVNHMSIPWNYMADAHKGRPTYGPYIVTRDNGYTSNITDWFALCRLDGLRAGSVVGLFIDRSGSMTQAVVQASYSYFYQRCAEAGIGIVEVQNPNEDWILPFIDEI